MKRTAEILFPRSTIETKVRDTSSLSTSTRLDAPRRNFAYRVDNKGIPPKKERRNRSVPLAPHTVPLREGSVLVPPTAKVSTNGSVRVEHARVNEGHGRTVAMLRLIPLVRQAPTESSSSVGGGRSKDAFRRDRQHARRRNHR